MDIFVITLICGLAFLAVFTVGWVIATLVMVTHAHLTGGNPRAVLNQMLEEW